MLVLSLETGAGLGYPALQTGPAGQARAQPGAGVGASPPPSVLEGGSDPRAGLCHGGGSPGLGAAGPQREPDGRWVPPRTPGRAAPRALAAEPPALSRLASCVSPCAGRGRGAQAQGEMPPPPRWPQRLLRAGSSVGSSHRKGKARWGHGGPGGRGVAVPQAGLWLWPAGVPQGCGDCRSALRPWPAPCRFSETFPRPCRGAQRTLRAPSFPSCLPGTDGFSGQWLGGRDLEFSL